MPAYRLDGFFFELCDCYTICPCWIGRSPDDNRCTGAFCWSIESGTIGDVDVSGRSVVSVSFHTGHRDTGGQEVTLFVDDGADDAQFAALATTFTGGNGGPLGELGRLMGALREASRAPISLTTQDDHLSVTVGRMVSGAGTVVRGGDGAITELRSGRLSEVLGPRAEVGNTSAFRVDLGGQAASVQVTGRAAMRGPFRYESRGEP
ncbi:DUF1326 domain-containing protein [Herbidospora yilanensis]|uniref:DUF1326 domain-containing protein n=1 Tax=Herbidospora yilanensis TaxID=354426 RepID=UPI00078471C2|nr:DUF1326 domain-containing protein [Herbidospora yilanensis]